MKLKQETMGILQDLGYSYNMSIFTPESEYGMIKEYKKGYSNRLGLEATIVIPECCDGGYNIYIKEPDGIVVKSFDNSHDMIQAVSDLAVKYDGI